MDVSMVEQVRRFNRAVMLRVQALESRLRASERSLTEARLLWEIGPDGAEVRALRTRLGLDSDRASHLLRALRTAGMVEVAAGGLDRRVRVARLTPAGMVERERLDQAGHELAESFLTRLSAREQRQLVKAMSDVERLLTGAMLELRAVDPLHPDARQCVRAYVAELNRRSESGYDPSAVMSEEPNELRPPAGQFVVATLEGHPVGCGGVKHRDGEPSHIPRLWVDNSVRRLGLGRKLLERLEAEARSHGAPAAQLEAMDALPEACELYRSAGYHEVPAFNDEPFADHWYEKSLR